jgi:uncharacterized membrane protein YhaH (DUF805 family)
MSDENLNPNQNQNTEQNTEKLQEISEIYNPQIQSQSSTGSAEVLPEMSPIDYYVRAFQKYSQFSGRATRSEYWWFYFGTTVVLFLLGILDQVLSVPFGYIYVFASFIPTLAVTARRLHDVGKSGWLQLLGFVASLVLPILVILIALTGGRVQSVLIILIAFSIISIYILIRLFILYIRDSTPGDNKYGPNPKGLNS